MNGDTKELRVHYLDGMRGWAALMVVLSHTSMLLSVSNPLFGSDLFKTVGNGPLAVYIFFVISGFVLSIGFVKTRDTAIIQSLALRRYWRLTIPIFFSNLIAYALMKFGLFYNFAVIDIAHSAGLVGVIPKFEPSAWSLLSFSLYDVYFNYGALPSYNGVLWTMSLELSGSMLLFSILAVFGKVRNKWMVYAAGGVLVYIQSWLLISFIYGLLLAELSEEDWFKSFVRRRAVQAGSLVAFGIAVIVNSQTVAYQGRPEIMSTLALATTLPVIINFDLQKLLETGLSRFMGKISFPLYLMHSIVLCSASSYLFIVLAERGVRLSLVSHIVLAFTIGASIVAAVCFLPIERLSVRAGRKFADILNYEPRLIFSHRDQTARKTTPAAAEQQI